MSEYEKYKTLDSLPIVTKVWMPDTSAVRKGVIQFVHGMCEVKERYDKIIKLFNNQGYICVISDLRGHGENVTFPKDLGYIGEDGVNLMVEDIHAVTVYIKNNFPDLPIILMSHSMGALLSRVYAKRYDDDLDMLVLLGCPSAKRLRYVGVGLTAMMAMFGDDRNTSKILDKLVLGDFEKKYKNEGANAWICSDRKVIESYSRNSKCGFSFTINGYNVLCKLMCEAFSARGWDMKNPDLRIVILAGADDPCIIDEKRFKSSVDIMKKVGYKNVASRLYKGMRHEILNEPEFMKVINDILSYSKVLGENCPI